MNLYGPVPTGFRFQGAARDLAPIYGANRCCGMMQLLATKASAQKGRELMWQDHVLLHKNNEEYFSAVRAASPELILRNLTDQVFELAHISSEKMKALAGVRFLIWIGFASWVVVIASGLLLERH